MRKIFETAFRNPKGTHGRNHVPKKRDPADRAKGAGSIPCPGESSDGRQERGFAGAWPTPSCNPPRILKKANARDVAAARKGGLTGGDDRPSDPHGSGHPGHGGKPAGSRRASGSGGRSHAGCGSGRTVCRWGEMRIPLGVIGIIYESRPNVTSDAAGLCLKAGNAVILRGGSEAIHSNRGDRRDPAERPGRPMEFPGRPSRSFPPPPARPSKRCCSWRS